MFRILAVIAKLFVTKPQNMLRRQKRFKSIDLFEKYLKAVAATSTIIRF
jgi:hypothetical protein